jgi:hypothetical protein
MEKSNILAATLEYGSPVELNLEIKRLEDCYYYLHQHKYPYFIVVTEGVVQF